MRIGTGKHTYEWIDNWAKVPESESARAGWAHTDVVVTESGDIITYHQGDPTVLVFDKDGNLLRSFDTGLSEGHGMTLVREGGSEHLWIADPGAKRDPSAVYEYEPSVNQGRKGQAVKMTLDGQTLLTLQRPGIDAYKDGTFSATAVAVYEERSGGNGDVWVADGYGESYVHRYDRSGNYVSSINGEEGRAGQGGSTALTVSGLTHAKRSRSCTWPTAATAGSRSTTWTACSSAPSVRTSSPHPAPSPPTVTT